MELRVHGFLPASYANGPGRRAVIWVQGCTLGCPGCFNPATHPFGGDRLPVRDLFSRVAACDVEGLTVSGGEPLQQRRGIAALLSRVRAETDLSVMLFTGYSWDEAQRYGDVLANLDILVAGRYVAGSPNKTVHLLTGRYTLADLDRVPPAELVIEPDGSVVVSGLDPPRRSGLGGAAQSGVAAGQCSALALDLDVERAHLDHRRLAHLDVETAP